jgi:hypothetical protein
MGKNPDADLDRAIRRGAATNVRSLWGQGLAVAFEAPAVALPLSRPRSRRRQPVVVAEAVAGRRGAEPGVPRRDRPTPWRKSPPAPRAPASEVSLLGDGALAAKDFVLANPPRIVVDLPGVKNDGSAAESSRFRRPR